MARWFDYQTVALAVIFAIGFGIVWCVLNLRGRPAEAPEPAGDWHVILGVAANAPFDEIERAYHAQLVRYDAESMNALGAEFSQAAKRKREAVEWAFSKARHLRGLS